MNQTQEEWYTVREVDVRLTLMGELNVKKRTNAIAFSPPSWSRNHGNTNMTIILAESRRNEPDQNFLSWYCLCVVWGGGREGRRRNNIVMCLSCAKHTHTMSCYPLHDTESDPCWSWSKMETSTHLARETLYRAGLSNKQQRMTPVSRN